MSMVNSQNGFKGKSLVALAEWQPDGDQVPGDMRADLAALDRRA
jgi:hypothetical protein